MNKIQIKAEILTTIALLLKEPIPNPSILDNLKNIDDKKAIFDIIMKEFNSANEQKSLILCWMLSELIEFDVLNDELWNVIKSSKYSDHVKMIAFNLLKDLGSDIDYDVINEYFEKFDELINDETKEILNTAIMNPETQIDFMDFISALGDSDKEILIKSLEEDYAGDALANILIPVFAYYYQNNIGDLALNILAKTKSQLAFHALTNFKNCFPEKYEYKINKALLELKVSGIRIDNTLEFYKDILSESKPYKSYTSFPDGHGNIAVIFSRIRDNDTIQIFAVVLNPEYGVLDSFGFNSISKDDFNKIIDKFYNSEERYEINHGILKHLLLRALEITYKNEEQMAYEYICWETILYDIEQEDINFDIESRELNQTEIDELCLNDFVQNWFFDEYTSEEFKIFINKLSDEYKKLNYSVDLDKFIADNFNIIYTDSNLLLMQKIFALSAYLRMIVGDTDLAQVFYSLNTNYMFLTNIIRKSIYEYYVGKRYALAGSSKSTNLFEKKQKKVSDDFDLLQLDMIISGIEAKWVNNG